MKKIRKRKMNKKGEEGFSTAKKFILLFVTLVILVSATYAVTKPADRLGSINKCKTWIAIESAPIAGKTFGIKSFGFLKLNSPCETWKVDIGKNEEIYEKLAEEMYMCWDMYGKGEKNWYSEWSLIGSVGRKNADKYCLVCSEVRFDEKLFEANEEKSIDMNELWMYMANNQIPGHTETYAEYFLKSKNANINTPNFENSKFNVDKNKPLYVTFHITKGDKSELGQSAATTIGTAGGIGASYLVGSALAGASTAATGAGLATAAGGTSAVLGGSFLGGVGGATLASTGGGAALVPVVAFMFSPPGLAIVAVVGITATVVYYAADDSYIAPSLMIFGYDKNDETNTKQFCDEIYYRPRESVLEKLKNENSKS